MKGNTKWQKKKDKQLCTNTAQMRKIEQHRLHKKIMGVYTGAPEG